MKTYLSVGIGDFVCLDSLLTKEEKENITEIYWGCRFGKVISQWVGELNEDYPNYKFSHFIDDQRGKDLMKGVESHACDFWHFRPDFRGRLNIALQEFSVKTEDIRIIDAVSIFSDPNRIFNKSSILSLSDKFFLNHIEPKSYILVHYPTSTRPRGDIASITHEDWININEYSKKINKKIIIISDKDIQIPIDGYTLLNNSDIRFYPWLVKNCYYYIGCDSFIAGLSAKCLPINRISIKSHDPNVSSYVRSTWGSKYFLPYSPDEVSSFYKTFLEYK